MLPPSSLVKSDHALNRVIWTGKEWRKPNTQEREWRPSQPTTMELSSEKHHLFAYVFIELYILRRAYFPSCPAPFSFPFLLCFDSGVLGALSTVHSGSAQHRWITGLQKVCHFNRASQLIPDAIWNGHYWKTQKHSFMLWILNSFLFSTAQISTAWLLDWDEGQWEEVRSLAVSLKGHQDVSLFLFLCLRWWVSSTIYFHHDGGATDTKQWG